MESNNVQSNEVIKFPKSKDYLLLKDIGQGGTGNTKLLYDETINENFVCKKYSPFYPEDKALYYNNFVDEIKILYKINHINIVRVFNYYLYPKSMTGYIIMEYIDGVDIENYISSNSDSINDIFIQTVEGFRYLEEKGILHRDIRPANILVSNDGCVKIIDFGFGKNINSFKDYKKSITLNWAYSLPDEFEKSIYDFRTEVYFIGKLFEQIIKRNNLIFTFKYFDLLSNMINVDYNSRIPSFFKVSRDITTNDSLDVAFSEYENKTYLDLANSFTETCVKMQYSTIYIKDFDEIKRKLEDLYQNSMLEKFIQNNSHFVSCFIEPPYRYKKTSNVPVSVIKEFLRSIDTLSSNKKKIILNNLWQRFDNINREIVDNLPF
ncbi:protein kinase family protein [uncultured Bacteroides sp.]|uniref:protein kinase family protein n=1 Tax=uncultured Bacteroides sp. TaxID=162156 RepID=UPI002AABE6DF|nr:protein kinase family protein [uncultured Bacteroides sp.]